MSGGTGIGTASATPNTRTGIHLPMEKVCKNEACFEFNGNGKNGYSEFCHVCGQKLEEQLADVYVELVFSAYNPVDNPITQVTQEVKQEPMPERKARVSIKELIHILNVYQKEVFVEKL